MQHLVIFLALFMDPTGPDIGAAMTLPMTAQACAAKIAPYSVYNDANGVRVFMSCETLDSANMKLQNESCKPESLNGNIINYTCEE